MNRTHEKPTTSRRSPVAGTVIAQLGQGELCVRTNAGWMLNVRVPDTTAAKLPVGEPVEMTFDGDGHLLSVKKRAGTLRQESL